MATRRSTALESFVPRALTGRAPKLRVVDGTVVFADLSGFTALSEKLARRGPIGAELLSDVLNDRFTRLLDAACGLGGDLLSFGGDALFMLFDGDGHAERAVTAAAQMRSRLRGSSPDLPAVTLRISIGVCSGEVQLHTVGEQYPMLIAAGPTTTSAVQLEALAAASEILTEVPPDALRLVRAMTEIAERGTRVRRVRAPAHWDGRIGRANRSSNLLDPTVRESIAAGGRGEHRRATVCFVEFTGTDELSGQHAQLNAALHDLVSNAQRAAAIHQVSLIAADVAADGGKLMFNAGAVRAVGDDDERAVSLARELVALDSPLTLRAGVNGGRVFVGVVGSPTVRAFTSLGDAVNIAARVTARAEPGQLLATLSVLDECATDYKHTLIEPFAAKGKRDLVEAAIVGAPIGRSNRPSSGELIGRGLEVDAALRVLTNPSNTVNTVVLEGEAGIGKSTIVAHLIQRLAPVSCIVAECGRYLAATPYLALGPALRNMIGADDEANVLARLEELATPSLQPLLPLIGIPFGLRLADTPATSQIAAEFRQRVLHEAVVELLRIAMPTMLVLVVEDTHWSDEASADLLVALIEADLPLRFLLARRPEGTEIGVSAELTARVSIEPLDPERSRRLVRSLTADQPLVAADVEAIVARAEGNPLYVRALVDEYAMGHSVETIPPGLDQMLQSRLDRCSRADRNVISVAAVIGQRFNLDLLCDLVNMPVNAIRHRLQRLPDIAELRGDEARFSHALIRDAAYESLPFRERRRLHALVADFLVERSDAPVELLAIHNFRAQRWSIAGPQLAAAARRAIDVFAVDEAIRFSEDAVDAMRRGPSTAGELDVEVTQLAELYRRAGRTASGIAFCSRWIRAGLNVHASTCLRLYRARFHGDTGRFSVAVRSLQLLLASEVADPTLRTEAFIDQVATLRQIPRPKAALALLESGADFALNEHQRQSLLTQRACLLGELGDERAIPLTIDALSSTTDRRLLAELHNNLGVEYYYRGEWASANEEIFAAEAESQKAGDYLEAATFRNNLGEIALDQGRFEDAQASLDDALDVFRSARRTNGILLAACSLIRLKVRVGDPTGAAEMIDLAHRVRGESKFNLGELDGAECELLLATGNDPAAAERADAAIAASSSRGTHGSVVARLHRLRGLARRTSAPQRALDDLRQSIEIARRSEAPFEAALSTRALALLEPDTDCTEADATLDRLGVLDHARLPILPGVP